MAWALSAVALPLVLLGGSVAYAESFMRTPSLRLDSRIPTINPTVTSRVNPAVGARVNEFRTDDELIAALYDAAGDHCLDFQIAMPAPTSTPNCRRVTRPPASYSCRSCSK